MSPAGTQTCDTLEIQRPSAFKHWMISMVNKDTESNQRPLGIIFALPLEAHTFERRICDTKDFQGQECVIFEGRIANHPITWTISGVGRDAASRAAQLMIDGHRPHTLISAGFAGGLADDLERGNVLIPDKVLNDRHECVYTLASIDRIPFLVTKRRKPRALITVDSVITSREDKAQLRKNSNADLVDMESAAVAQIAQEADIPFLAVRAISDTYDETLPPEVSTLSQPQSPIHRFGAALAAITRRPRAASDLWRLWEQSISCSRTLADQLEKIIQASG